MSRGWARTQEDDSEELRPYSRNKTELSVQDGCLLWGRRVVIPPSGRIPVTEELHESHPGTSRMKSLARSYVWWPGMDMDLEKKVCNYVECQTNAKMPAQAPLAPVGMSRATVVPVACGLRGTVHGKNVPVDR